MTQLPDFKFDNTYAKLSDKLFSRQLPTAVSKPSLIKLNTALAKQLNLPVDALLSENGISVLAGNALPEGADPIAMAYAGHQFGNWVPQLGDGRAVLLGEVLDQQGTRFDIQLKGAGPTPYSRNGDGRAALGPVIREYVVSEAMAALGVPTTRALSAVSTGDSVRRETMLPGAILARVAESHVRVGTFQFFAARGDLESIKQLTDYIIDRHYPDVRNADQPALALLKAVMEKQASLVAQWQSIGFIHGVMNTDNASVAGITIDYGPCAFMDIYHPETIFSSIDHNNRYAYQNQPPIAQWNMANLAQCLLPLIDDGAEKSVEAAQAVIDSYPEVYALQHLERFRNKLGLMSVDTTEETDAEDTELIASLLKCMEVAKTDFTNTFRTLGACSLESATQTSDDALLTPFSEHKELMITWLASWRTRHLKESASTSDRQALMRHSNPAYIPRNHRIEQVIQAALQNDYVPMEKLITVLATPYNEQSGCEAFAEPPAENEVVQATFCGT